MGRKQEVFLPIKLFVHCVFVLEKEVVIFVFENKVLIHLLIAVLRKKVSRKVFLSKSRLLWSKYPKLKVAISRGMCHFYIDSATYSYFFEKR